MKFESLMLRSLFAASLLICALTLGAMLKPHPLTASVAVDGHVVATTPVDAAG